MYVEYVGVYEAPNFQSGEPPFLQEGGFIEYGVQVAHRSAYRVTAVLHHDTTTFEQPESGWPLCMGMVQAAIIEAISTLGLPSPWRGGNCDDWDRPGAPWHARRSTK